MMVFLTIAGVVCAAAAGVLLYRCGVEDGIRLCRRAQRNPKHAPEQKARQHRVTDVAEQQRQWQEMINFMQYDGSEMPRVKEGNE